MKITEQEIADYLAATPDFFDRHAELLATIQLVSPHGKRAVSLQERHIELQRDKTRALELKAAEMVRFAQENEAIQQKLMRWVRALLMQPSARELPATLARELQQQFAVPQVGLKVWNLSPDYADIAHAQGYTPDAVVFANSLTLPYCGINSGFEAAQWVADPLAVQSLALIPLRPLTADAKAGTFGLLVFGSPDSQRFQAGMGTEFLARIGELSSAALGRLLPH